MNKVLLVGRITKDPEVRYTTSGIPSVQFSLAVDRGIRDANGNRQADFINCVVWRQQADFMSRYIKKGYLLSIEGRIQTRNYDDKDGKKVYVTEVIAEEAYFADTRRDGESNPFGGGATGTTFDANTAPSDFTQVTDDDLPF